jgi:ribosomal protein L6P/L9E
MIIVNEFYKIIRVSGVGYRASNQGQKLDLALGFHTYNIVSSFNVRNYI